MTFSTLNNLALIATLFVFNQIVSAQSDKYLSNAQIFKLMSDSKVAYNVTPLSELDDSLKKSNFSVLMFPQLTPLVKFPLVKKSEDDKSTLSSFEFQEEAWTFLNKGEEYFGKRDFINAKEFYSKAIENDPSFYLAALYLGDCYLQEKDYNTALSYYQKANAINPNDYSTWYFQSTALRNLGEYEKAVDCYREALLNKPRHQNIMKALNGSQEILGITVDNSEFVPKSLALKKGDDVFIYFSEEGGTEWLAYANAKAIWLGETAIPGLKEPTVKSLWSTTEEKQAIISLLDGYYSSKENDKNKNDKYLEKLYAITQDGLLDSFIIYEIGSRINPNITLILPDEIKEDIRKYIRKYVVVDKN
ncbi:MAG: tetratricopeptide repeat protein [Bacteroidetes bacterium]|nr:tetratricopeptide repeat protein [Bacteroidota bacterium]